MRGERTDRPLQVHRVPEHDGGDDEVEPGRPVPLVLEAAVAQFTETAEDDGAGEISLWKTPPLNPQRRTLCKRRYDHNAASIHQRSSTLMFPEKPAEERELGRGRRVRFDRDESSGIVGRETREREVAWQRERSGRTSPWSATPCPSDADSGTTSMGVVHRAFSALAGARLRHLPDGPGRRITFWGEGARLIKGWTRSPRRGRPLRLLYPDGGPRMAGPRSICGRPLRPVSTGAREPHPL